MADRNGALTYAQALIADIAGVRFRWASEDDLQRGLAQALQEKGYVVEREVRLNAGDRIDLVVDRVGIEVKPAGAARDVERQLVRYLESDRIDELVLVPTKAAHRRIVI